MEREVIKRDGRREPVQFDKITTRIRNLSYGLDSMVDVTELTQKVCAGVYHGVHTSELDELAAQTAAYLSTRHSDYSVLASRIAVSNLHKNTKKSYFQTSIDLYNAGLLCDEVYKRICEIGVELDHVIAHERDFSYDYFGFKTLEKSYLLRIGHNVVERPQFMLMRVAVSLHVTSPLREIIQTYELLSRKYYTHASPTLFNAGSKQGQLSSCFLVTMKEDSIEGIFDTLKQCAVISKGSGGIGVSVHNIRAAHSKIRGSNGVSSGLVPMLRVYNDTARYVDQGGGKRKGAFAVYLEPWHSDIFDFLQLRRNTGPEERRARDLFYALWIPDLFMKRVEQDASWSLMCPDNAPGLADVWGNEFDTLYERYERDEAVNKTVVPARKLWFAILESQIETGTPYMLYKDACNAQSNQRNLGTIRGSNLCAEIVQFTSPQEVAVCNLASISLSRFVVKKRAIDRHSMENFDDDNGFDSSLIELLDDLDERSIDCNVVRLSEIMMNEDDDIQVEFDLDALRRVSRAIIRNLDRIIDINQYPIEEAEFSNRMHRPLGLGVQGLADALLLLQYPFESENARKLNKDIFETIYYGAMQQSVQLSKQLGPYPSYQGSPLSQGRFQFDLCDEFRSKSRNLSGNSSEIGQLWDWNQLRDQLKLHGARHSLLLASMPTASTSQMLGNHEGFEPYTSNVFTRRVLAGEFAVVNRHLLRALQRRGLWNEDLKQQLIAHGGSVQHVPGIPQELRVLFKTVWEIPQRVLLDMSADRGLFIDQSQSLNVYMAAPSTAKLSSMHFYGWKKGLKTGMYYLRTRPAASASPVTIDPSLERNAAQNQSKTQTEIQQQQQMTCSLDDPEGCLSCGA